MSSDRDKVCYELLLKVFRDNAYASIELNSALLSCAPEDKPYITKLFYGVLERNVYYDYVLSTFAKEKPKKPIVVIIKMGYYMLENMSVPEYAVVNNMVALCKRVGKGGAAGFVNSALRKVPKVSLPPEGSARYLSVAYGYPEWLTEMLIGDYGYDFVRDMLSCERDKRTHIRVNVKKLSASKFAEKYAQVPMESSGYGYYISHKDTERLDKNDYVVQSAASVIAAKAYVSGLSNPDNILDLCAAPGGKSVLMNSLTGARVTACDIHPHRVELIKKYAAKYGADITAVCNDATVPRPEWGNAFSLVVCDVPCSGIGVAGSKPDILFNRSASDIDGLTAIQSKILDTASGYVKSGGRLCYSTCTVLKRENGNITTDFVARNPDFRCIKEISLFPHIDRTDGFYVAVFERKD